ncbi:hypothetical protein Tco_0699327 [Tanacetum coccineum]
MAFISTTFASRYPPTNIQLRTLSNPRNQATTQDGRVIVQNVQGRQTYGYTGSGAKGNATRIGINRNVTDDLDAFDSDCDEAPSASAVLIDKLSAYDSDVLSEVPNYDTYQDNNVIDQSVQEMQYSEQPVFGDDSDIDITSDNNVISYDQYIKDNKSEVV